MTLILSCSKEKEFPTPSESELYFEDGEMETLFQNKVDGIDVIFIGDGYIKNDLQKVRSTYRNDALKHFDYLFRSPPFSEYTQYFNAHIIYAESEDEGPVYDTRLKSTALGIIQGEVNPEYFNQGKLGSYVREIFPILMIMTQKS